MAPTPAEEETLLDALTRRDAHTVSTLVALWPQWAVTVRPCKQPTVHYLLQHGEGSPDGATVDCIEVLLAHGAQLDVRDETGGSVLHSAVAPRPLSPTAFAEDVSTVLSFVLRHPLRPSYHAVNHLGLTAAGFACRVGNVPAIDALLATTYQADPVLSPDAISDATWEEALIGIPIGLMIGARLNRGVFQFQFRDMTRTAAKHGRTAVLDYLLKLSFPASMVERLSLLEGNMAAVQAMQSRGAAVHLWSLFPLITDPADEWQRLGSPLQAACGAYSEASADGGNILNAVTFMIEHARSAHITLDEQRVEDQRLGERYHDHVAAATPAAVYALLRAQDAAGRCAMHFAADGRVDGSAPLLAVLLGVDAALLQTTDRGGRTPLDAALRGKKESNAKWLVAQHGVSSVGSATRVRASGVR
jgi:hypothetical protein